MTCKVACIQLTSSDDVAANIAVIEKRVAEAAKKGAQLVTLPENAFLMESGGHPRLLYTPQEHPGLRASAELARKHHVWLLAGSVALKVDESGKTVNRCVLFDERGNETASYDKLHLFDVDVGDGQKYAESERIVPGSHAVVTETPWGKLGLSICYDVRFPVLYRTLAKAGAVIITVPSAFTQPTGEAHWHTLLRARAIENGAFIIAPAQCGTHPSGRQTYGHSLIVDPWGKILVEAGTEESVIMAELDIDQAQKVREKIPSLKHDRPFTLKSQA